MAQTHKSLRLQIQRALDSCQSRARQRTLTVEDVMDAIIRSSICDARVITIHAGSVPLSYRGRAESTQVVVTRHARRRYTVSAIRTYAGKCRYGRGITVIESCY